MFRKTKRVIASLVLVCGMFSLTAFSSASASTAWTYTFWTRVVPAGFRLAVDAEDAINEAIFNSQFARNNAR